MTFLSLVAFQSGGGDGPLVYPCDGGRPLSVVVKYCSSVQCPRVFVLIGASGGGGNESQYKIYKLSQIFICCSKESLGTKLQPSKLFFFYKK